MVLGTEVTLASSIDSERSVSRGMPQHCCVPLCSSNSSKNVDGDRVGFHSFPSDPDLLKRWNINIRRDVSEHFSLNAHTKVCSLHFEEDDFHPGHERRDPSKKATTQLRRKPFLPRNFVKGIRKKSKDTSPPKLLVDERRSEALSATPIRQVAQCRF